MLEIKLVYFHKPRQFKIFVGCFQTFYLFIYLSIYLVVVRVEPERHVPLGVAGGLRASREPHQSRAQGEPHQGTPIYLSMYLSIYLAVYYPSTYLYNCLSI